MAAAAVAGAESAAGVAATGGTLSNGKRLFRCVSSGFTHDLLSFSVETEELFALEHTDNLVPLARSSGLEFFNCHFF